MIEILAVFGVLALVFVVVRVAVPVPTDRPPQHIVGAVPSAHSDELLNVAATYVNAPLVSGNRIELLENGDEIFPAMLGAIEEARGSVHLLTYVYWTGAIAQRVARSLARAAARGVRVRLLLDAFGASSMDDGLVREMEEAGVEVAWFHRLRSLDPRRLNNRTHRKVMVVDGDVAFTGGVGIAQEWTGHAQDSEHWRDDHFRVEGPVVRALQGAFVEEWLSATGTVLTGAELFPRLERRGDARMLPLFTSPRARWSPVAFLYWWLLCNARESVDIATPYFLPDAEVTTAIHDAARRGVRVRLLVPDDHNDSRLVRWGCLAYYPALIEAGVELYEFTPTLTHTKAMVVDGRWSVVGSANFDYRSFALNDEVILGVDEPSFASTLIASFEADLKRSRRIDMDTYESLSRIQRALGTLTLGLRAQL